MQEGYTFDMQHPWAGQRGTEAETPVGSVDPLSVTLSERRAWKKPTQDKATYLVSAAVWVVGRWEICRSVFWCISLQIFSDPRTYTSKRISIVL